jgi:uncharacterized membrane protein YadS
VYVDAFSAPLALDVATVTKLVRNLLMALAIPYLAFRFGSRAKNENEEADKQTGPAALVPLFVLGFVIMAAIRSVGDVMINAGGQALGVWNAEGWQYAHSAVQTWAGHLLVVALAGVGLSIRVVTLKELGLKPLVVGLGAALIAGVVSFAAICLLEGLVVF